MKKEKPNPDLESVKESGQYRKIVLAAALAVLILLTGLGVTNLVLCFSFGRGLFCPKQWSSQKASNTNSSLGTSGVDQINTNNRSPATTAQNSAAPMTNRALSGAADTNYKFEWKNWSDWSGCSKPCGEDGIQTRKRECKKVSGSTEELAASDKCPDSVMDSDTRNCISNPPCDKFEWKNWSDWSECSKRCGEGTQTRKRECQKVSGSKPEPAASDKCDSAMDSENQKCKSDPPCEFKWSEWSMWCTNFHQNLQKRNRLCNMITNTTKEVHVANPTDCNTSNSTGSSHEDTRKCDTKCEEFSWRDWSEWTPCDKRCGGGKMKRSRPCWVITGSSKEDKTENKNCEDCLGEKADEFKQCNQQRCRTIFS